MMQATACTINIDTANYTLNSTYQCTVSKIDGKKNVAEEECANHGSARVDFKNIGAIASTLETGRMDKMKSIRIDAPLHESPCSKVENSLRQMFS